MRRPHPALDCARLLTRALMASDSYVWEVLESARKVFFVSLIRLLSPGTFSQLVLALGVALSCLIYQLTASPYKQSSDNSLAVISGTSYCLLLLGALALKINDVYVELRDQNRLSPQLEYTFSLPALPILVVLMCSVLASVVFAAVILLREALRDFRQPKLRYSATKALVSLPLSPGKTHHVFVSHATASRISWRLPLRVWPSS